MSSGSPEETTQKCRCKTDWDLVIITVMIPKKTCIKIKCNRD